MATITNRQSIKIGATFSEYAISQCPERMLSIRKFLQGPRVVRRSPKAWQNQRKQWMPAETSSNPASFCNISNQFVAANNWKYTIFKEFLWKNVKKIDYISNDSSPLVRLKKLWTIFCNCLVRNGILSVFWSVFKSEWLESQSYMTECWPMFTRRAKVYYAVVHFWCYLNRCFSVKWHHLKQEIVQDSEKNVKNILSSKMCFSIFFSFIGCFLLMIFYGTSFNMFRPGFKVCLRLPISNNINIFIHYMLLPFTYGQHFNIFL